MGYFRKFRPGLTGYTLLETLIYVSILGTIVILAVSSFLSIHKSLGKVMTEKKIFLNGDIAMETMTREIRAASSTDPLESVFGASPGVIKLNAKKFFVSGDILKIQEGANPTQDLTSDVKVTELRFFRSTSSNSELIKIEMEIEAGSGTFLKSKKFFGSALLRGMY